MMSRMTLGLQRDVRVGGDEVGDFPRAGTWVELGRPCWVTRRSSFRMKFGALDPPRGQKISRRGLVVGCLLGPGHLRCGWVDASVWPWEATLDPHIFVRFLQQHRCSRTLTTPSLLVGALSCGCANSDVTPVLPLFMSRFLMKRDSVHVQATIIDSCHKERVGSARAIRACVCGLSFEP